MFGSDGIDRAMLKQRGNSRVHVQFHPACRAERAVGSNGHAEALGEIDEGGLNQIGVKLDLQYGRLNLRIAVDVEDERAIEVAIPIVTRTIMQDK